MMDDLLLQMLLLEALTEDKKEDKKVKKPMESVVNEIDELLNSIKNDLSSTKTGADKEFFDLGYETNHNLARLDRLVGCGKFAEDLALFCDLSDIESEHEKSCYVKLYEHELLNIQRLTNELIEKLEMLHKENIRRAKTEEEE